MHIKNVSKSYSKIDVFNSINMDIQDNMCTVIMGPSGCGKTTLLRMIAGLEKCDCGTITGVPDKKAYVFQEDRLCDYLTALDNVLLVVRKKNADKKAECERNLASLGLEDSMNKYAGELSGGMKRRVAIARALMADSDIILMDEPFTGLDSARKDEVMKCVKENIKGRTVILVTHDEHEARIMADDIIRLK